MLFAYFQLSSNFQALGPPPVGKIPADVEIVNYWMVTDGISNFHDMNNNNNNNNEELESENLQIRKTAKVKPKIEQVVIRKERHLSYELQHLFKTIIERIVSDNERAREVSYLMII